MGVSGAMRLYCPVGLEAFRWTYRSGMRLLPEQPDLHPSVSEAHADQRARDDFAKGAGAGYLLTFEVDDACAGEDARVDYNPHLKGDVRLKAAHFGPGFTGDIPKAFSLRGKDASAQLEALVGIHGYSGMDFHAEVTANHEAVFLHFPYWEQLAVGGEVAVLEAIREVWAGAFPTVPLGLRP
jgi:hypothetical protein